MIKINRVLFLFAILGVFMTPLDMAAQQNLIRNHSFENGRRRPTGISQIDRCNRWKNYETRYVGGPGSSDWFKASSNAFQGSISCRIAGTSTHNIWPFVPSNDGLHYAGIVKWEFQYQGEGVQQKLVHKLDSGYYHLEFNYLIPCDTMQYGLEVYFGTGANHLSHLAVTIPIPSINIGQWQTFSQNVHVPPSLHRSLDWFIVLNTGQYNGGIGSHSPYIYLDDFHLEKVLCFSCDPNGLISWNDNSMRPYFTPNNDGIFDQWCMTNINNVSWYEFLVVDRSGVIHLDEQNSDVNGFENLSLCWDGRNLSGQMPNIPKTYYVKVRLGNCGSQITEEYTIHTTNFLGLDTFSVAQNYVPPLFGLNAPPTHFKNLNLYGGIYYGTHDWFACDSILIGGSGEPRVPYFTAGSTSDLGFFSTEGTFIDIGNTDFHPGSDIDINPQPVQCCPPLRLQNPNLPVDPLGSLDTLAESPLPFELVESNTKVATPASSEFKLEVFPSPANDVLKINFYLPKQSITSVSLVDAAGISVFEVLDAVLLDAGSYAYSVSVKAISAGIYVLRFGMGEELVLRKVVVQH